MKHGDSRAGLTRYSLRRNTDGIDVPDFPADPGKNHAVVDRPRPRFDRRPHRGIFDTTDTDFDWEYTAECGATVKVLLTIPFDDADADACGSCASLMAARARGPEAHSKEVSRQRARDREARRRADEREREEEDVREWNRAQNRRIVREAFPALRETREEESPEV